MLQQDTECDIFALFAIYYNGFFIMAGIAANLAQNTLLSDNSPLV